MVVLLLNRSQHTAKAAWEANGSAGVTGQTKRWASHSVVGWGQVLWLKSGESQDILPIYVVFCWSHHNNIPLSWSCLGLLLFEQNLVNSLELVLLCSFMLTHKWMSWSGQKWLHPSWQWVCSRDALLRHALCSLPAVHHSLDWITWAHYIAKP